jgi:hypothetical protein
MATTNEYATAATLASIPKLTGSTSTLTSNYSAYKFRISRILKEKKLLSIVDGSEPKPVTAAVPATTESATTTATTDDAISKWEERDEKAFTIISVIINDD